MEQFVLLTIAETAKQLRLSTKTVRRYVATGDLVSVRIGRRVLVSRDDLAVFVQKHRNGGRG